MSDIKRGTLRERIYEAIEIAKDGDKLSLYYDRFMIICIVGSIIQLCFKKKYFCLCGLIG